jgi:hypothetical protein
MKTTKRILAILAVACLLLTALTACGGSTTLNGTYQMGGGLFSQSYSFDRNGNVTVKTATIVGSSGTYSISGNRLTITVSNALLGEVTTDHTFKKSGSSIYIDGSEYIKID